MNFWASVNKKCASPFLHNFPSPHLRKCYGSCQIHIIIPPMTYKRFISFSLLLFTSSLIKVSQKMNIILWIRKNMTISIFFIFISWNIVIWIWQTHFVTKFFMGPISHDIFFVSHVTNIWGDQNMSKYYIKSCSWWRWIFFCFWSHEIISCHGVRCS